MRSRKREIYREIVELTAKQFLLSLFDVAAVLGSFDHRRRYARAYTEYLDWRAKDYRRFYSLIYRLKTAGLIEVYEEDKEKFITLTSHGRRKIGSYLFENKPVPIPKVWDGRWRLVIFDIPEEQKRTRNIVRQLLNRIGFYQLQKSVYVYPHECIGIIRFLEQTYDIDQYVQFVVAERIETEVDLIKLFHERGIIKQLKSHRTEK
ncbi:CRISPR-associated endonuclease Cas2 [Candidatus Berkelbacteria bacterium]|nr:CRISPR-associated endonuclease Cas2 [Candidatus Berkelbacteria bacterium]